MTRCGMKKCKPSMDDPGNPAAFHYAIAAAVSARTLSSFSDLQNVLVPAGRISGACLKHEQHFRESANLQSFLSDRRRAQTVEDRKRLIS